MKRTIKLLLMLMLGTLLVSCSSPIFEKGDIVKVEGVCDRGVIQKSQSCMFSNSYVVYYEDAIQGTLEETGVCECDITMLVSINPSNDDFEDVEENGKPAVIQHNDDFDEYGSDDIEFAD